MKTKHFVYLVLVLSMLLSPAAVQAVIPSVDAASMPWGKHVIDDNKPDVRNLSTTFVGNNQVPMMSWGQTGLDIIYRAHRTLDGNGNCGPDDAWRCLSAGALNLVDGTISNLATETYINTHVLRWAYSSGSFIRGLTIEQHDDMSYVTSSSVDLVDLSKFGGALVGPPSLVSDGLRFRMAFTARESGGGDFPLHQLVYMHYSGTSNNSCKDASLYQCDVIEQSYGPAAIGTPSLQVAPDGAVGIAYYKDGEPSMIRYAYPWTSIIFLRPANCGPGGTTWRCINIDAPSTGTLGLDVKMAFGSSNTAAGIVYNYKPVDKDMVMRALYVGSGGDCGQDGVSADLTPIYRWRCSDVDAFIDDITATTYSIAFDPEDYPVIAWNNKFTGDTRQRLYLAYPAARSNTGGGWVKEIIDGNDWSTTGHLAALSISADGLGFIGYMQPTFRACGDFWCPLDDSPNLKAALQVIAYNTYIPSILR
jgi:hypothetical protein